MSPIPSHTNGNIQNPQAMTLSEAQPVAVRWFLSVYSGHWVTAGTHAGLLSLLFPRHVPPACRPPLPPSGRPRARPGAPGRPGNHPSPPQTLGAGAGTWVSSLGHFSLLTPLPPLLKEPGQGLRCGLGGGHLCGRHGDTAQSGRRQSCLWQNLSVTFQGQLGLRRLGRGVVTVSRETHPQRTIKPRPQT